MSDNSRLSLLEKQIGRRRALLFVALFVVGWLALLAVDWYQRFTRYEFEKRLISRPRRPSAIVEARPLFTTNQVPASRGGDLTQLIGIRSVAKIYEEERPPGLRIVDRYGYMNRPYDPDAVPDVVVVGDSFMAAGHVDELFATRLSKRSGLFVYNHSLMGHGPFISLYRFLDAPRFTGRRPPVVVWGFAEREISGEAFVGMVYQLTIREQPEERKPSEPRAVRPGHMRVNWRLLEPHALQSALPDTSFAAQSGEWLWNRARYYLFRQLTGWVVEATDPVMGKPILFYRYHIDVIAMADERSDPDRIGRSAERLVRYLRERGMELVVVLIPEKEQVYRRAIPPVFNPPDHPIPPSILWEVEEELERRQIRVVNLLRPFREAAEQGQLIYWRDDTHWNPHGIDIAVDIVWEQVEDLWHTLEQ